MTLRTCHDPAFFSRDGANSPWAGNSAGAWLEEDFVNSKQQQTFHPRPKARHKQLRRDLCVLTKQFEHLNSPLESPKKMRSFRKQCSKITGVSHLFGSNSSFRIYL